MISVSIDGTIGMKMARSANKLANEAAMIAVGLMAHEAWVRGDAMLSLSDHSLADLAAMGHPYAVRAPNPPHSPEELVHEQMGDLRAGLQVTRPAASHGGISAVLHNVCQPLDTWIQLGTRFMVGRPYIAYIRKTWGEDIAAVGRGVLEYMLGKAA